MDLVGFKLDLRTNYYGHEHRSQTLENSQEMSLLVTLVIFPFGQQLGFNNSLMQYVTYTIAPYFHFVERKYFVHGSKIMKSTFLNVIDSKIHY